MKELVNKVMIFTVLCLGSWGLVEGVIAVHKQDLVATVEAVKEVPVPQSFSKDVTITLIATTDNGKVKIYRLVDYQGIGRIHSVCYVTVGELHGKTVATECK